MVDKNQTQTGDLWDTGDTFTKNTSFCVFGPAWYYNFCMGDSDPSSIAAKGGWGFCQGPESFYWGGMWICVAEKSDNKASAANLLRKMTLDESVLREIAYEELLDVNDKSLMSEMARDSNFGNSILGGQNPYGVLEKSLTKIDASNMTVYDQIINNCFQTSMDDYFDGRLTYDAALNDFYQRVQEVYPELY